MVNELLLSLSKFKQNRYYYLNFSFVIYCFIIKYILFYAYMN